MACELSLFLTSMPLYMGPERCPGGSPNDQIRYRKHSMTDTERMHSFSTYSQEQHNQRALYHLCSFVFTYAEIKSNSAKSGRARLHAPITDVKWEKSLVDIPL